MKTFHYKAFGPNGAATTGEIRDASAEAALDRLAARRLTPVRLVERAAPSDAPWWARELTLGAPRVPDAAWADALKSLGLLLGARLSLIEALRLIAEDARHPRLRAVLARAAAEVEDGRPLAAALAAMPGAIAPRLLALIRLGEAADQLAATVRSAAETLERDQAQAAALRGALAYPIVLTLAAVAVLAGLIFVLAPTLAPVFRAMRADPPGALASLLAIRAALLTQWPLMLAAVAGTAAAATLARRAYAARWERLWLRAPVIGPLARAADASRGCRALHLMLAAGAPLLTALQAAGEACRRRAFKALFAAAEERVRAGGAMSDALRAEPLAPPFIARLVRVGERTDQLRPVLADVVAALDVEVRRRTEAALGLMTPVITLVLGGLIGAIVLSTLAAILEINDVAFQ